MEEQPRWKWNSIAHRLIGEVARIDHQLTEALAIADARDEEAFDRLIAAYGRRSTRERVDALRTVQRTTSAGIERVCSASPALLMTRNRLAHGYLTTATEEAAEFVSRYRGKATAFRLTVAEARALLRLSRSVQTDLDLLLGALADVELWGRLMGFDKP